LVSQLVASTVLPTFPPYRLALTITALWRTPRNFVAGPTADRCELRPRSEFDDIFTEILTVADTLTDGIMKQFPEKLR
jgi:hypothetical protein